MTSYCAVKTQPFLHQGLLAVGYDSDFHVLGDSVIVVDTLDTFSGLIVLPVGMVRLYRTLSLLGGLFILTVVP